MKKILKFLRFGSRHRLYFPNRYKAWPQLNPICSCSHGPDGKRTWSIGEPLWSYRLRRSLTATDRTKQRCGRRGESLRGDREPGTPDGWRTEPNGDRCCTYCGSLHPDDFMRLCKAAHDDATGVDIETTDKQYKVYVKQPGVMNASMGGIKFYMAHAPAAPTAEDQETFSKAVKLSHARWLKRVDAMRGVSPVVQKDGG